jgi:hypothetical protein
MKNSLKISIFYIKFGIDGTISIKLILHVDIYMK